MKAWGGLTIIIFLNPGKIIIVASIGRLSTVRVIRETGGIGLISALWPGSMLVVLDGRSLEGGCAPLSSHVFPALSPTTSSF